MLFFNSLKVFYEANLIKKYVKINVFAVKFWFSVPAVHTENSAIG